MQNLNIDIETRSSVDIGKAGLYKYAQSPDFEILLFAYKMDDEEVQVIDLAQGQGIPRHILDALRSPSIVKHAYNAAFEWYCLNRAGHATRSCSGSVRWRTGFTAGIRQGLNGQGMPSGCRRISGNWRQGKP